MRRALHVRPCLMHRMMNHERGRVQQPHLAPVHNLAVPIDADEVAAAHGPEGDAEGIHPERVWLNRVADRDMARHAGLVPELAEDAQPGGQTALQVLTLLILVREGGRAAETLLALVRVDAWLEGRRWVGRRGDCRPWDIIASSGGGSGGRHGSDGNYGAL